MGRKLPLFFAISVSLSAGAAAQAPPVLNDLVGAKGGGRRDADASARLRERRR